METYKITTAFDGKDITPKNFYRKSPAGRDNTAQALANAHEETVLLIDDTGDFFTFYPTTEGEV